jgi:NAD(P)-dependent dehydrogenase (short-subunit alcohol dehydrogenase family)
MCSADELFDLSGRVALIVGGTRGIGRAAVDGLARRGASVAVVARTAEDAARVAAEVEAATGRHAMGAGADASDEGQLEAAVAQVLARFGRIDILVNSAGAVTRKPPLDVTPGEFDAMMAVNVRAIFLACRAVAPQMVQRGRGKIINVSSVGARIALELRAAYCASKGAVSAYTRALAAELAPAGVHVNAVAPGYVVTDLSRPWLLGDPERTRRLMSYIPAGRFAEPRDMEGTIVFLASAASDYLFGQTIYVDGGWSIW